MMDVDLLLPGFTSLRLERVNPAKNEKRFYYISWQPTLLDSGAVVRIYGRKGECRRIMAPIPFPALPDAWPFIRAVIRRRLRNGYRLVEPTEACSVMGGLPGQPGSHC